MNIFFICIPVNDELDLWDFVSLLVPYQKPSGRNGQSYDSEHRERKERDVQKEAEKEKE